MIVQDNEFMIFFITSSILLHSKHFFLTKTTKNHGKIYSLPAGQPPTEQFKDGRIYWQLELEIWTTLDFRFNYKREFIVYK